MQIKIIIKCDNAAFDENPHIEVSRILEELSLQVNCNGLSKKQKIYDLNGNNIGYITAMED